MRLRTLYGWIPDRPPSRRPRAVNPDPSAKLLRLVRRCGEVGIEPAAALLRMPVEDVITQAGRLAAAGYIVRAGVLLIAVKGESA